MTSATSSRRVCLIGAGFISQLHADALAALPGVTIAAIVDPNLAAAERLAARWRIPAAHASLDEALAAGGLDAAHVLTPPDLHEPITSRLLEAGLTVLVEKPLTPAKASSLALTALAESKGLTLGVNQNFVFHPAFARLRALIDGGAIGRLKNLACLYRMPLRQLQGRQFGHWMFRAPQNLLLEQAVHPLSQVRALVPDTVLVNVSVGDRLTLSPDKDLLLEADVALRGRIASVQFHFALGADFSQWELIASGTDGIVVADIVNNRCYTKRRTRWLEPTDQVLSGLRSASELAGAAVANAWDYGLAMVKLKPRSDAYYLSMKSAIADYHQALERKQKPLSDGRFATELVGLCEKIAEAGGARIPPAASPAKVKPVPASAPIQHDLLLIGGTGFIGRAVLKALGSAPQSGKARRIAVLARNVTNLPAELFDRPNVTLIRGSFIDADAVGRAIAGCRQVVHLAHGMGSGGDLVETMRGGTRLIAEQCLAQGVERLVYIGSIASLYLGDPNETITAATPPDPLSAARGEYARAKALCDQDLFGLHKERGLPVVNLRPGLVVGEGTSPFHSGLGFYNNEQHCMGWSDGRNPLPFVLVEDVADAIVKALEADGVEGSACNIIGEVRPTARRYVEDLAAALGRPLRYHGQSVNRLYAVEWTKWLLKRAGGRKVPVPSKRDLASRALFARFDCSTEKRALGWQPNADERFFHERAIKVFGDRAEPELVAIPARPAAEDAGPRRLGAGGG